ncbi:hypothetical protein AB205_0020740 [Aquarana catesbeiana]|uniref:Uncharacterized protein n=1 Tax=Aquarana catesbeiana TaxID=8400 RepID=A0A2G9SGH0_AQUCT|nr:hypothetical protein AB205_0020740 [Aquarana catesbeiana]
MWMQNLRMWMQNLRMWMQRFRKWSKWCRQQVMWMLWKKKLTSAVQVHKYSSVRSLCAIGI